MTLERPASTLPVDDFGDGVVDRVSHGGRFAGLFASASSGTSRLTAVIAWPGRLELVDVALPTQAVSYPALTPRVPAAGWYEREIHDLFGLVPDGHPRLDPLVLPLGPDQVVRLSPGAAEPLPPLDPDEHPLPGHVAGEGTFTIPYGPVRSGVFESVEYLVETPGEDIPHLRTRIFHKHRGLEKRFEGMTPGDGVLLAERVEGVASVAHAMAFCQALEQLGEARVPCRAGLVRVVHAELERVANHLDSIIRHTEAAGQAVAYARLSLHKERVLRLRSELSGSRFARGVVVTGGVSGPLLLGSEEARAAIGKLERAIRADTRLLMATPSFLDRLRGTGPLPGDVAAAYGALGPLARGSSLRDDSRVARPYGAYRRVGHEPVALHEEGDALARQHVRLEEIWGAFHLIRQSLDELDEEGPGPWRTEVRSVDGLGVGWVEAPQGELLYLVEVAGSRLSRVKPRSASFHNLALLPMAFRGDIFTDFAFIEASFALSVAGAAL